jgi:hypothetical protein
LNGWGDDALEDYRASLEAPQAGRRATTSVRGRCNRLHGAAGGIHGRPRRADLRQRLEDHLAAHMGTGGMKAVAARIGIGASTLKTFPAHPRAGRPSGRPLLHPVLHVAAAAVWNPLKILVAA